MQVPSVKAYFLAIRDIFVDGFRWYVHRIRDVLAEEVEELFTA